MTQFNTYNDIDITELDDMEIKELIGSLVDNGYLPEYLRGGDKSFLELAFLEKLGKLSTQWVRISLEDEKTLEELFKKYLQGLILFDFLLYLQKHNIMRNLNALDRTPLLPTNDGRGNLYEKFRF